MINREIIRIKIVQLTYAYYQNGNKNLDAAEKELLFSLSKAYDLYNYMLALIVAVTHEARKHLDVEMARAQREKQRLRHRSSLSIVLRCSLKRTKCYVLLWIRRKRLGTANRNS